MNDAQSTVVGLKAQDCPGGGWTGQPPDIKQATVADCLAHDVCGCIYGDAVQQIEQLRKALRYFEGCAYPVATEINPRGHAWRGEDALDFALGEARAALAYGQ